MDASAAEQTRTGTQPAQRGSGTVSTERNSAMHCLACDDPLSSTRIDFLNKKRVPRDEWDCRPCHKKGKEPKKLANLRPASVGGSSPYYVCPKCKDVMVWSEYCKPGMEWTCDGCGYEAVGSEWRWYCRPCAVDFCGTCMPRAIVAGTVTLASAAPPPGVASSSAPDAPSPLAPAKPPGVGWKQFHDSGRPWWYYNGELGQWWYSTHTEVVAPYTQADHEEVKCKIRELLFPAVEKLKPDLAGKITDRLLELDSSVLMRLLESETLLKDKVDEYLSAPLRIGACIDGTVKAMSANTVWVDIGSFTDARLNVQQDLTPEFQIGDQIVGMLIVEVDKSRQKIVVSLKDPVLHTQDVKVEQPDPATDVKVEPAADDSTTDRAVGHPISNWLPRNPSPDALPPGPSASQPPPADPDTRDRKRARHEPRSADQSRFPKCAQCRNTLSAERTRQLELELSPQAEWRCIACTGKHANWAPTLPREVAPSSGNDYGLGGSGNKVSLDGYWSSNSYPLLLWRIAGHVANAAHNQFCLLCPYGRLADRFCNLSKDGRNHIAIGELIVGEHIDEPDLIKWDDGETWYRREGLPSAYIIGDRWSGAPALLPALTSPNTEWIRQPPQSCYNAFVLYKLCSVCSSSSSNNSSVSSCTPGATPERVPRASTCAASEVLPPWRK